MVTPAVQRWVCGALLLLGAGNCALAQNTEPYNAEVEVGVSFVLPQLQSGTELLRAQDLREAGQSYYADENGQRANVGSYRNLSGYQLSVGWYKPLRRVRGLKLGALVRNVQTGSTPSDGGYAEAYFFNFITAGVAAQYRPLSTLPLFVKADFGLAAVLTKNRYVPTGGTQSFFHQFGIGTAFGAEVGYVFSLHAKTGLGLELKTGYQWAKTRVEVNGIGDDRWGFGALSIGTALHF